MSDPPLSEIDFKSEMDSPLKIQVAHHNQPLGQKNNGYFQLMKISFEFFLKTGKRHRKWVPLSGVHLPGGGLARILHGAI